MRQDIREGLAVQALVTCSYYIPSEGNLQVLLRYNIGVFIGWSLFERK
jgi:hypothetical protein